MIAVTVITLFSDTSPTGPQIMESKLKNRFFRRIRITPRSTGYVKASTTSSFYPPTERREKETLQPSSVTGFQLLEEVIPRKMVSEMSKTSKISKTCKISKISMTCKTS
jgi:hypothetical protein